MCPCRLGTNCPVRLGWMGLARKKYGAWSRTLTSAQRGHRSTVSVDLSLLPDFGTVFALNTERYDVHKPALTHCDFEVNFSPRHFVARHPVPLQSVIARHPCPLQCQSVIARQPSSAIIARYRRSTTHCCQLPGPESLHPLPPGPPPSPPLSFV